MAKRFLWIALTAWLGIAVSASSIKGQDPKPFFEVPGPLLEAGKFNSYFKLQSEGPQLGTKIETSYQKASDSLSELRRVLGGNSGSSSSGDQWSFNFRGTEAYGEISFGTGPLGRITGRRQDDQAPELRVKIQEFRLPRRELSIKASEDGDFQITVRSQDPASLFRFKQDKDKRIFCLEFSSEQVFAAKADSFDQFCSQHHEFVEQRLFPILTFLGTGVPITRFSPSVQDLVLRKLAPPDPEMIKRFRQAVDGLDVSSFQDRQAASKKIEDDFETWRDLIQVAISDSQYPLEVRSRLKKIFEDQVPKLEREQVRLAHDPTLQENPAYLVWLWEQLAKQTKPDAAERQRLIENQLSRVTSEQFGADLEQWKSWLDKASGPNEVTDRKTDQPLPTLAKSFQQDLGPIDSTKEFLGQLLQFKREGRDLILDRDHWAAPFGGKTIREANEEIAKLLAARNLPTDWYRPGGNFAVDSVDYPQAIFENMESVLSSPDSTVARYTPPYSNRAKSNSLNRRLDSPTVEAALEFHDPMPHEIQQLRFGGFVKNGNEKPPERNYFLFYLRETVAPYRSLEVRESQNGALTIELLSETTDSILRLSQAASNQAGSDPRRVQIVDVRDGKLTVYEGPDFQTVLDQNRDYLLNQWQPLFEKMGIQLQVGLENSGN